MRPIKEDTESRVKKWARNFCLLLFPNFKLRSVTAVYAGLLLFIWVVTEIVYAAN